MMRSLYSGVAGLRTHQTRMDVIGNNIANVNTYGYKSQRATFRDMYYQTTQAASEGKNSKQLGYGSQIGSIDTMMDQAGFASTDRPLDAYIDGEGFFVVQDPQNTADVLYTRLGALSFMPDSTTPTTFRLVDMNGNSVKGVNGNAALTNDSAISTMNNLEIANFNDYTNISVGSNGKITGIDGAGTVQTLGTIAVAKVPNPEGLSLQGNSYYKAIKNTGTIVAENAGEKGVGGFVTGALEMSNVDLASEFTSMITAQRGYQANSRIISVVDSMLEELVNLKR